MMENSRYNLHDDKRFKDELDGCYFHPSRKYASEEIKFTVYLDEDMLRKNDKAVLASGL